MNKKQKRLYHYPKYYELVFGRRNIKKECKFIKEIIEKFSKIKTNLILDIACGTGPHMGGLSNLNFKVAGLDLSEKMLKEVNEKLSKNKNFIKTYKEDMANFKLPEKFDACICMVNSLEILSKNEQFISHFESVANCLKEGGIYLIELDNPSFIFSAPPRGGNPEEYKRQIKEGKIKIDVNYKIYSFDLESSLEKSALILNIDDDGKKIEIIDDSPVRRLMLTEIDLFLKINKKFELIRVLGDFDLNSKITDKNAKKMIIILRKK